MAKPWGYTHLVDTTTNPRDLARPVLVVLGAEYHPIAGSYCRYSMSKRRSGYRFG